VNFYLRILRRRQDGYHLLESIVAPVSLFDSITLKPSSDSAISLRCRDESLGPLEKNLVWRAADLLRRTTGVKLGLEIHLRKRIPAGAGLGGGSSDAAAVLLGLNQLWGLKLTAGSLANLAAKLGADVPFFLTGKPAVMRGIGDRLSPLDRFPLCHLVILWPRFAISTAWAYREFDRSPPPTPPAAAAVTAFLRGDCGVDAALHNDLQRVAVSAHPKLKGVAEALRSAGAAASLMTGSGSAVFGVFPSGRRAMVAARELRRQGHWAVAARTLGTLPPLRRGQG